MSAIERHYLPVGASATACGIDASSPVRGRVTEDPLHVQCFGCYRAMVKSGAVQATKKNTPASLWAKKQVVR